MDDVGAEAALPPLPRLPERLEEALAVRSHPLAHGQQELGSLPIDVERHDLALDVAKHLLLHLWWSIAFKAVAHSHRSGTTAWARLEAGFGLGGFSGAGRAVAEALKRYGMIVADNGSDWFISGTGDPRWDDHDLDQLKRVPGAAFEVADTGPVLH